MSYKFEVLHKNAVDLKFLEMRIETAMSNVTSITVLYKSICELAPEYDVSLDKTKFLHALQRQTAEGLDAYITRLDDEAAKHKEPLMLLRQCGVNFGVGIKSDSERLHVEVVIRLGETHLTVESFSILWEKIRKIHDGITITIDQFL